MTLLCKLCWRLLVDQWGFWFKVLTTKCGFKGGYIMSGTSKATSWWNDL